ncbi:MAG: 50S ribosomal protein L23 [Candidatus Magasanikbacteria bacterium CG_4_10_14_0_8_um_filter_32_14]|uniref:Large ribosomal subunit protein uL23 n=1 Tax=Candidatus Magasanikbacteria bacterium CG_4_10_14_0_8_um_filter_32_14 TaxID=1974640 RepID=A0A2M7R9A9_9BACT|nr:MAG: 50S ribosomal protein L23 [Candidatus Magasanikbacteria bacterium CG_4_10_14_0_8_um_filter_32_14]
MGLLDKWSKKQDKKTLDTVVKTEGSVKTTKSVGKTKETKKVVSSVRGSAYRVILKPLVSEKASAAEINGRYTFLVNAKNNKTEIKQAIKQIYGIVPIDVNVMNFEGKCTRSGTLLGKRTDYKKAIVTLAKGHTINIHEGV